MKRQAIGRLLHFSVSTVLISAIFMTYSMTAMAQPALTGELLVAGTGVVVNGEPGTNGRTLVLPSNIMTTGSSYATLNFGKVGKIQVSPGTTFTIDGAGNVLRGTLSSGAVTIVNVESPVTINTPCGKTVVTGRAGEVVDANTVCGTPSPNPSSASKGISPYVYLGIAGAVLAVIIIAASGGDDGGTVSPVR